MAAASLPDGAEPERPFRRPAGLTPELAAVADRNVVSTRCALACTMLSRIHSSADGDESATSSFEQAAIAPTFSGVSSTSLKSGLLTGMPFDPPPPRPRPRAARLPLFLSPLA